MFPWWIARRPTCGARHPTAAQQNARRKQFRELLAKVDTDIILVEMIEVTGVCLMEKQENTDDLRGGHKRLAALRRAFGKGGVSGQGSIKTSTDVVDKTESVQ